MNYIEFNISDGCLQHYELPPTVFCFENYHYRSRPSRDNLQVAAPNSNESKKIQGQVSSSQFSWKTYKYFPDWWALLHWRSNGTYHCLENFVERMWQIRFCPLVNKSFRRKQPISHIKRTTRTRFCKGPLFAVWGFSIDLFVNGYIEIPLISHFVMKLPVNER